MYAKNMKYFILVLLLIGVIAVVIFMYQNVYIIKVQENDLSTETIEQAEIYAEYCFDSRETRIKMEVATTSPFQFVQEREDVIAAINGVYYAADDDQSLGIAYTNGKQLATGKGLISGYFVISNEGEVEVLEEFNGQYDDYQTVIGTHPLLVKNGTPHLQAFEPRYELMAYRSAIGTKNGSDVCFVVSEEPFLMSDWSKLLASHGYKGALNLDGGPISQLVTQDNVYGGGGLNTRLIIFATTTPSIY